MFLISHRGNIAGPLPQFENSPRYINSALKLGFDVELDLWKINKKLWLGHDMPQYEILPKFLYNEKFWIHAKNLEALEWLQNNDTLLNYFWHEKDKFTITSFGDVWAYPSSIIYKNAINVMPELNNLTKQDLKGVKGICSDYISNYK